MASLEFQKSEKNLYQKFLLYCLCMKNMGIIIAILVLPSIEGSTTTFDETKWETQGWRKCCDVPGNGMNLKTVLLQSG